MKHPKTTVAIDPNAKPLTTDLLCLMFFGMTLDKLAQEIAVNKNGKYDRFYGKNT